MDKITGKRERERFYIKFEKEMLVDGIYYETKGY